MLTLKVKTLSVCMDLVDREASVGRGLKGVFMGEEGKVSCSLIGLSVSGGGFVWDGDIRRSVCEAKNKTGL